VLPLLYLHGLSTKDFVPALAEFFGSEAGLSAAAITRLTKSWSAEREAFMARDLSAVDDVYVWVDGIHFSVRLGKDDRLCVLVMVGVRTDGTKELIALTDGYRESTESWAELLRDAKRQGMRAPVLAVGDGALGFWAAVRDVFPKTRWQRDWVHKVANVLNALPASVQTAARRAMREIWDAEDRDHADKPWTSSPATSPNGRRPYRSSPVTVRRCWPSTTIRPSTGSTFEPRTLSSRRSHPCGPAPT